MIQAHLPSSLSRINLLIKQSVFDIIAQETVRFLEDDRETGGILVGKWLDSNTVVIVAATGPGDASDHAQLSFSINIDYANQEIEHYGSLYPDVNYVGEWHKHPPILDYPSGGDLYTARQLLSTPGYPARLVTPIVVVRNGSVLVNFYYLDKSLSNFVKLQKRLVSDQEIENLLSQSAQGLQTSAIKLRPKEPPWWKSPKGETRLQEEEKRLKDKKFGFMVKSYRLEDSTWLFEVSAKELLFKIQCFGKYPNTNPIFDTYYKKEKLDLVSEKISTGWREDYYLIDACAEIKRNLKQAQINRGGWIIGGLTLVSFLIALALILVLFITGNNNATISATATAEAETRANEKVAAAATITAQALVRVTAQANITATAVSEATSLAATATSQANITATAAAIVAATENAEKSARAATITALSETLRTTPTAPPTSGSAKNNKK